MFEGDTNHTPKNNTGQHYKLIEKELSYVNAQETTSQPLLQSFLKDTASTDNEVQKSLAEKYVQNPSAKPLLDVRTFITVNDCYRFTKELFNGNTHKYQQCMDGINTFTSLDTCNNWLLNNQDYAYDWDNHTRVVQEFYAALKKKFV